MKRLLFPALLAGSLLAPATAPAAYNPALVSAEARWVVHADLERLRASTLGKELVAFAEKAQTEATGGKITLNLPKLLATIGTVTAYGTNLSKEPKDLDGALIAQGTPELRKILESVLLQGTLAEPKNFAEIEGQPFPVYSVADGSSKEAEPMRLFVAFPPEPIVIASRSQAQLLKAREVFRGAAPSVAKSPGSPLARLAPGAPDAYVFTASVVPTEQIFPQNAPQARILQLASAGALAFGERGPNTYLHARLVASSGQNAEKLMKILQGLTAMLSLAESNDRQLAEFLNSAKIERDDRTVTLDLAYASTRLAEMVQTMRAEAAPRPAQRPVTITSGTTVAEWGGDNVAPAQPGETATRTIEDVALVNGATVTIGRAPNGGQNARFVSIEIIPAGGGAPMVFRPDFMRQVRGTMWQFPFPGVDGRYTLRVNYVPDAEGRAKFAVSVREPKSEAAAAPAAPAAPRPPGDGR